MNVLIINTHQPYPFSEGKLSAAMVDVAAELAKGKGHQVQLTTMTEAYDIEAEVEKHLWADLVILQIPVNWMGVPWSFKKYMDEVYTTGMMGALCDGDGRSRENAGKQYGSGGKLSSRYLMSLTFNAPQAAFDDEDQFLFEGKGVDDLMFPMHMNFRFFGMSALPTFASFDVMKNPDTENDLVRFQQHLAPHL
ncbi:NAD(P)H-dependent oxidoreductase [Ferrimonas balearica]|uniref:NAD(P)H-dependent oxidoreductase n=1 Tax=Ferrimonas balearica TaxID=44012 RepID=UPI001C9A2AB1|nr:NAD(P)H-dependent oxidoreductase [Ferrimonas balearica]MBY5923011.1 NAD(P)H-dependent oxidoreductase [Ferrimonas balearica]MBY5997612.1 NAD(P)H-dependent oxidoreductase [Ferrimonas balearica]